MKRNKITAVILSIVMSMSLMMPSVEVLADEASAPSETQKIESTETQETIPANDKAPQETKKQDPKITETQDKKETEKSDTETTETQESKESESQEPKETEAQVPKETEAQEPKETETQEPKETEAQEPKETEKQLPEVKEKTGTEQISKVSPKYASGSITRERIDSVCSEYGFNSGTSNNPVYWSYDWTNLTKTQSVLDSAAQTSYKATHTPKGTGSEHYVSKLFSKQSAPHTGYLEYGQYVFNGKIECYGFAEFLGYKLTGQYPSSQWTHYTSVSEVNNAGGIKVGDVIRAGGHSAFVLSVSGNTFKTVEVWSSDKHKNKIVYNTTFNSYYNTIEDVSKAYNGISYVARFNGTVPSPTLPTNTWIKSSCGSSISPNTNVTLTWGASNAVSYWLHIYKDGSDYYNQGQNGNTSWSHTFTQTGTYTCYITPYGKSGYISSSEGQYASLTIIVVSAYISKPSDIWIKASCGSSIQPNTSVTLNWGANNASSYWLHIYKDGADYYNEGQEGRTSWSHVFTQVGTYTCYITPYGQSGYQTASEGANASVTFTVESPKPSYSAPDVYAFKVAYEGYNSIRCSAFTLDPGTDVISYEVRLYYYDANSNRKEVRSPVSITHTTARDWLDCTIQSTQYYINKEKPVVALKLYCYDSQNEAHYLAEYYFYSNYIDNIKIESTLVGNHVYYRCDHGFTIDDAKSFITTKTNGKGRLVSIPSREVNEKLKELVSKGSKSGYYTSGWYVNSLKEWKWVAGSFSFTDWKDGKPNYDWRYNASNYQNRMGVILCRDGWIDDMPSTEYGFIYEVEITQAPISRPNVTKTVYCYNGETITVIPEGFDSKTMTISGNSAITVGKYILKIGIADSSKYVWSNGSANNIEIIWEIAPHSLERVEAKEHTDTDDGNIEYWHCKRCDKDYSDQEGNYELSKLEIIIPAGRAAELGETAMVGNLNYKVTNPATDGTGTVTLIGAAVKTAVVSVPSSVEIKGNIYKVTRIETKAFYGDKTIKTVYIGNNIVIIDSYAFYGCSNLTKVSGGKALKTIGSKAFAYCSKLKTFSLTSAVLYKIGTYAFQKDKKLKTVYIKYTTKLTKSGVKKSLKSSSVKTVKVKKSKVKKYKKYFKKKNSGRSVKVKK